MANPNTSTGYPVQNVSTNQSIRLIAYAKGANMGVAGDTALPTIATSRYSVTAVIVTNASASLAQAYGGLYTAPAAGGTCIVANAALSGATTAAKVVSQTVASTDAATVLNLYYKTGTANTAAATADIYVYGYDLTPMPS